MLFADGVADGVCDQHHNGQTHQTAYAGSGKAHDLVRPLIGELSRHLIAADIIKLSVTEGAFMPVAAVGKIGLYPAAVCPEPVHGICIVALND